MPASFARDLCGLRSTNRSPNTSDNNDEDRDAGLVPHDMTLIEELHHVDANGLR